MDDELMSAVPVPLVAEPTNIPPVPSTTTTPDNIEADKKTKLDEKDESQLQAVVARRRLRAGRSAKAESSMLLPSFIWDYFVKDTTGKYVICTLCPDQATRFAYSGGTSTMNRHLRKKHQKFAPGKTAADYEMHRSTKRSSSSSTSSHGHAQSHATSPAASSAGAQHSTVSGTVPGATSSMAASSLTLSDSLAALGSLSPSELTRRHLIDLRNSRRRGLTGGGSSTPNAAATGGAPNLNAVFNATASGSATGSTSNGSKRRKIALLDGADSSVSQLHAAAASFNASTSSALAASGAADFDPSGFVNLPMANNAAGALELGDAMDLGFVPGLDYTLPGSMSHLVPTSSASSSANAAAAALGYHHHRQRRSSQASQRIFTHRLLKYLIAQYEPLDTSHMGNELFVLLYGSEFPLMNVKLPSEDALKSALASLYYSQREILKEVLSEVEMLSLSLNNWKSVFGQNVLVVSGHWITNGFHRRDCVLEVYVVPLDESVNTVALLRDVMAKWDLPISKIAALTMVKQPVSPSSVAAGGVKSPSESHDVHVDPHDPIQSQTQPHHDEEVVDEDVDDGEDHFAFFSSDESGETQEFGSLSVVNCFLHSLRNAMNAGLAKCASLVRRCHDYASYFIQNPSEYQLFLALQKKALEDSASGAATATAAASETETETHGEGTPGSAATSVGAASSSLHLDPSGGSTGQGVVLPVICDHDNQWNSVCAMICRIVQLEDMFALYKCNLEQDQAPLPPPPSVVAASASNTPTGGSSVANGASAASGSAVEMTDGSLANAEVVAAPHHRRAMQLRFVCCDLTVDEKQNLKELARLLEPIETLVRVTKMDYPSVSLATPLVFALKKHLEDAQMWITMPLVTAVRNAILQHLDLDLVGAVSKGCLEEQKQQQQLVLEALAAANNDTASLAGLVASGCVGVASACSAGYLACLLDPRFKSLAFLGAGEKDRMTSLLHLMHLELIDQKQAAAKLAGSTRKSSVGSATSSSAMAAVAAANAAAAAAAMNMTSSSATTLLNEFFPIEEPTCGAASAGSVAVSSSAGSHLGSSEVEEKLKLQVQEYLDSPLLAASEQSDADVFDWWNRYQRHFPLLAKLARKYLCICATSGSFVEEFSLVGGLQKEKKKRLDIEIVAQILFCQSACRIPEMERMNV